MKPVKLAVFLGLVSLQASAAQALAGNVDSYAAAKIAQAYALGADRNIQEKLDGETLEEAFAPSELYEGSYEFSALDRSGDCAFFVKVKPSGDIDLEATFRNWRCD